MPLSIFILIFICITIWFFIDYHVGKRLANRQVKEHIFPLRQGPLTLFVSGHSLYEDLFLEIEQAKDEIHILFYIVKHDEISKEFLDKLKQKAKQGVTVRLLLDWIGSFELPRSTIKQLKQSGIHFAYCNKPKIPFLFFTLNRRNHRKITVIDGQIGYIGGFNIGQEYLGLDPRFGIWKDYHLKLTGEGVMDLQTQFSIDWKEATGVELERRVNSLIPSSFHSSSFHFASTGGKKLEEEFISLIEKAEKEICIGTPYFIPSQSLLDALLRSLAKGINITILVPMKADHPFVKEAAFSYFPQLLQGGARIFQYYYGFLHSKTLIIDEAICDIGTANFDKRSLFLNEEINCYIYDPVFIRKVKQTFLKDLEHAEELLVEDLVKRKLLDYTKQGIARLLRPLL